MLRYRWFSREMTFEKRARKFHTDDASLPRYDWMRQISNQSPVWNFSDVISRGNQWWRRQMSGRLRKLINVDLVTFLFCFVIIYVCMQFTLKDFLNRLFPVIKAAIYTFFLLLKTELNRVINSQHPESRSIKRKLTPRRKEWWLTWHSLRQVK